MKAVVAVVVALLLASSASAQSGGVWMGGPWQPSRVSPGYLYYNSTAPVYPISANPFGAGGYGYWQRAELRQIRWSIEDARDYRGRR